MPLASPPSLVVAFLLFALSGAAVGQQPSTDADADAILKEIATSTTAAKTLSAVITLTESDGGPVTTTTGSVKLKKPNFARIELGKPTIQTIAADGKSIWFVQNDRMRYQRSDAKPGGNQVASFRMVPVGMFFDPEFRAFPSASSTQVRFTGKETLDEVSYRVVEFTGDKPCEFTLKCYAAPDGLVTRTTLRLKQGARTRTYGTVLTNVRLNEQLPNEGFAYTPPGQAVRYDLSDPESKLIPVGETAFRFTVPTPDRTRLSLDESSMGKKAVLVSFWYYGSEPCRREFTALQKVYEDLKSKGFEVIALNLNDSSELINSYVSAKKLTFKVGMCTEDDDVWKEYHVPRCPTNYLLDSEGKIVWRKAGFEETELRDALKALGVQ